MLMTNGLRKKIRETTPLRKATNDAIPLGETLVKQLEDLFDNNYKYLKNGIEEAVRD